MAKAKAREYREMAADLIATKIKEMEADLYTNRLMASQGKLENTALLRTARKDIARAKTILAQKNAAGK